MWRTDLILYRIIEKIQFLRILSLKGGIRFKWSIIISILILIIIIPLSYIYILMSTNMLLSANDKQCRAIADNIASTESFIMVERETLRRSLILQDIVNRLSQSNIDGFVYAAVYDLRGMLVEKKYSYAAHTNSTLRGKKIPGNVLQEIKKVEEVLQRRVNIQLDKNERACYEYRIPFKFFDVSVGVIEIVFTEESVLGPVYKAKQYVIISSIIVLIIGVLISMMTTWRMVKTITELKDGAIRIREGDLDVRLQVKSHDEIGILTDEFNEMIRHLREKIKMQKFVSESTVSIIKGSPTGYEIRLGGSRMELAFLFSDIRGFTAMSEKLPPEEVVEIINKYLDVQAQIIKKNGGDIDKFIGDEVMAVFSGRDKADNAMRASVEIIKAISVLNKERESEGKHIVEVGIGLEIGTVVHARIGSRDRMDNTSIGDAVNLASRLCSRAKPGAILASANIVAKVAKKRYIGKKLKPIRVKGKSEPVPVYLITNMKGL
ncbi:MAG: adenylate/guanylate cyclase domain-containing protein [Spirochaetota bacterium]|nr:adenylate/guanylate cyclase domain-containing protein [Spirochaetota bacterium]